MDHYKIKVLFVCLGNICRSPMAEGVFKKLVKEKGLESQIYCDSAGTSSYHIGNDPDERMCQTASGYSITLQHKARQLKIKDFEDFDYIIAMDSSNFSDILKLAGDNESYKSKIGLMRDYDLEGHGQDVPDPYYGGIKGFDEVYHILRRSTELFLQEITAEK